MSLYVLDTDILTLFRQGHPAVCAHARSHPRSQVAATVISAEENLSGWYSLVRQVRRRDQLAQAYQQLAQTISFLGQMTILSFTEPAILRYDQLKAMRLNVAGKDLRIAAIALECGAVVVTRNIRDFQRVPNLVIEDWTT
jgi:tRNA(fMet)-specific endonuclease VapC